MPERAPSNGRTTAQLIVVGDDKTNGKELASVDLPDSAIGTPMTYRVDDKQCIALTVQGARQGGVPELLALTLR